MGKRAKFQMSEEFRSSINAVAEYAIEQGRGAVILHEVIENLSGIPRFIDNDPQKRNENYYRLAGHVRKAMERDASLTWWNDYGVGYKVLSKDEHIVTPTEKRSRRARKQINIAMNTVGVLADENLSMHQRKLLASVQDNLRQARKDLLLKSKINAILNARQQRNPRLP